MIMKKEKNEQELLKEKLFYKKKNTFENKDAKYQRAVSKYADGYKKFLDNSKTEREAVKEAIKLAEKEGFKEYTLGAEIVPGGKYYLNNRGKSLYIFKAGEENIENGVRICASHIDSPRLDMKQHPLYENEKMAYLKTH